MGIASPYMEGIFEPLGGFNLPTWRGFLRLLVILTSLRGSFGFPTWDFGGSYKPGLTSLRGSVMILTLQEPILVHLRGYLRRKRLVGGAQGREERVVGGVAGCGIHLLLAGCGALHALEM